MKKKIILIFASLVMLFSVLIPLQPAYAACPGKNDNSSKDQVLKGLDNTGSNCSSTGVSDFLATAVKILSYIAGIAAIIMILVAGFKYITSSGDSAKVTSAKNTLIYALIGVAVAVLAQFLVNIVLSESNAASLGCTGKQHVSKDGTSCVNN